MEKLHLIYQGTPKYQFRKQHLHSVIIPVWVGGLLGINNTFLKDRGVVTDNFNKKENGVYNMQMVNSSEDAPSGAYLYGTMIVFGNSFVTQIYIPYNKGLMYIRQYYTYSSVWSSWRKTDLSIV